MELRKNAFLSGPPAFELLHREKLPGEEMGTFCKRLRKIQFGISGYARQI
jgi:hypothetical protein